MSSWTDTISRNTKKKSKTLTDTGTVDDEFFEACPTEDDFEVDERWDETEATDDADDLLGGGCG